MDLIYTNKNRVEQGIITNYLFDQEDATTTANDCTFEIQVASENNVLEIGSFVYIPGTELGGRVDSLKVDTASKVIYASGRTWRGLLATKLLVNVSGGDYIIQGNPTTVFNSLLNSFGMSSLFEITTAADFLSVNVSVPNYTDLYEGILKAITSKDYKMKTVFEASKNKVVITFEPIGRYTSANTITSDMFEFKLQTGSPRVNHAIGVSEELVAHRYLQADGTIGSVKYYSGIDEITAVYDLSADTEEELILNMDEALMNEMPGDSLEVTALNLEADLGDLFEAEDIQTGIKMSQNVTRKIAKISHDIITYQYKVGERRL